jgi:hypothetical protein
MIDVGIVPILDGLSAAEDGAREHTLSGAGREQIPTRV